MKVNIKRARYQQAMDTINAQESDAISFGLALGCHFCRDLRRFGKKRLNALIRGTYWELEQHFRNYRANEDEQFSMENVPILYTGLRNQVKALDVDVETIESSFPFAESFKTWRNSRDVSQRKTRYMLLQDREKMFRSIWYGMILYVWRTYSWGRDRLTRLYRYIREQYAAVFNDYLECRADKDQIVRNRIKTTVSGIESLGVTF